jgi:hypothetical protein
MRRCNGLQGPEIAPFGRPLKSPAAQTAWRPTFHPSSGGPPALFAAFAGSDLCSTMRLTRLSLGPSPAGAVSMKIRAAWAARWPSGNSTMTAAWTVRPDGVSAPSELLIGDDTMAEAYAFISYVRENKDIIDLLAKDLQSHGVKIWLDRNDSPRGRQRISSANSMQRLWMHWPILGCARGSSVLDLRFSRANVKHRRCSALWQRRTPRNGGRS